MLYLNWELHVVIKYGDFQEEFGFKGIVHPKMKFTHPQAILAVYDFLLSD